jgi:hypothetical protein
MKSKLRRKADGPGWFEVIFGAALSILLGVVLAAAFLVFKPVTIVQELPKVPVAKMVYYLEGSRNSLKTREVGAKRKLLGQAGSIVFNEEELNAIVIPPPPPPTPKKMELPQPATSVRSITPGNPNFRIKDNILQIAVPVQLNAFEMEYKLIVQTRGAFSKDGEIVVFRPGELYVGSCPLEQFPAVKEYLLRYLVPKVTVPDEVAAAWNKVSAASVEGSTVRITTL